MKPAAKYGCSFGANEYETSHGLANIFIATIIRALMMLLITGRLPAQNVTCPGEGSPLSLQLLILVVWFNTGTATLLGVGRHYPNEAQEPVGRFIVFRKMALASGLEA